MRIPTTLAAGVLALTLFAGACSDDDTPVTAADDRGDVDAGPPDLEGTITDIEPFVPITEDCTPPEDLDPDAARSSEDPPICTPDDQDILGTILVEEDPADPQGGRKVSFTATSDSLFFGEAADGSDVVSFEDLTEGQKARTWVPEDGACAESYPEQCDLRAIDVTG